MYAKVSNLIAAILIALLLPASAFAAVCEIQPVYNAGSVEIFGNSSVPVTLNGTKFTASQNCTVTAVGGRIYMNGGTRTDNGHAIIYSDSAGTPNAALETGANFTGMAADNPKFATSTFAGTLNLVSGTTYWVIWGADTNEATSFVFQQNGLGDGVTKRFISGAWGAGNNPNDRAYFEIDGTTGSAAAPKANPYYFWLPIWFW